MARGNRGASPREPGRRWGRALLIVLLVGIVLLIAADRIGVVVAERTVATQTRAHLADEGITLSGNPSVHIGGFPFLTQVLAGRYSRIDIDATNPAGKGIRMDSLDVTATGVHAPTGTLINGGGTIEASHVVGIGQIGWTAFGQVVDLSGLKQYGIDPAQLVIAGTSDGHVTMTAPVSIAGATFNARATGAVSVANSVLHVSISDIVATDSSVPAQLLTQLDAIKRLLTFDVPLPALPYRLKVDSVRTTATGVTITASADNVVLAT